MLGGFVFYYFTVISQGMELTNVRHEPLNWAWEWFVQIEQGIPPAGRMMVEVQAVRNTAPQAESPSGSTLQQVYAVGGGWLGSPRLRHLLGQSSGSLSMLALPVMGSAGQEPALGQSSCSSAPR